MVFSTSINTIKFILFSSVVLVSCSKVSKENRKQSHTVKSKFTVTDTTTVNGVVLELIDNNGKGELKVNSHKYKISGDIKVNAPCYFLKNNNKILSYSYPDIGVDNTILIQGKSGLQGIIFKKDSIIYEDYLSTIHSYDVKIGADEIVYYGFAHRTHKIK
ncbi:hypothetical protein [Chryseobacterium daeguense]|uniref:hypothetical protein n=1 Tax=Chryseobacterium daeguense TaxID=412438 RepID=UPI00048754F8|nr:hypothetical protein [Chryseobacterium daeguense]